MRFVGRLTCLATLAMLILSGCGNDSTSSSGNAATVDAVTVTQMNGYYYVTLDYTKGLTRREIGREYGADVRAQAEGLMPVLWTYLKEIQIDTLLDNATILERIADIKPNVPAEFAEEIEGFADAWGDSWTAGETAAQQGDVWPDAWSPEQIAAFSSPEFTKRDLTWAFNLLPDLVRNTQCSALAAWGSASADGKTVVHRNLDWFSGLFDSLAVFQALVEYRYPDKKLVLASGLGDFGCITGVNATSRVFGAILDSEVPGTTYDSKNRRSYNMDLREALERGNSASEVTDALKDPTRRYTVSHLILAADRSGAAVLENVMVASPDGASYRREVRKDDSILQPFIDSTFPWNRPGMVGAVNAHLLKGQPDNYTQAAIRKKFNEKRWELMDRELRRLASTNQGKYTLANLRDVMTTYWGSHPTSLIMEDSGDLYNSDTCQMMDYVPETNEFWVFFRPFWTVPTKDELNFIRIPLD